MSKRKRFDHAGPGSISEAAAHRARFGGHPGATYWIYGRHAAAAVLANPRRRIRKLIWTAEAAEALCESAAARLRSSERPLAPVAVERGMLDHMLAGAVHQGVAMEVHVLPVADLTDLTDNLGVRRQAVAVVLDQVTDPQNVGATMRSAAAFGADAVIVTERNAAPESGALAKAASGALDLIPLIRVPNLARAIDGLKEVDFWCIGLARDAERTLAEARPSGRIALVLGSEGHGLRRLTRERCDLLARLPTSGPLDQLNVSNAAAVALYELARERTGTPT